MTDKQEAFGVLWEDRMLGFLSLSKPSAEEAIEAARHIKRSPWAVVPESVVAVHVPAGSDDMVELDLK
jgi:hypothetical protein